MGFYAYRKKTGYSHENEMFSSLCRSLEAEWANKDEDLYLLGSFDFQKTYWDKIKNKEQVQTTYNIDALVLCSSGMILIDLKDYVGRINAVPEDKVWTYTLRDGSITDVGAGAQLNPYQQLKRNEKGIFYFLKKHNIPLFGKKGYDSDNIRSYNVVVFRESDDLLTLNQTYLNVKQKKEFRAADLKTVNFYINQLQGDKIDLNQVDELIKKSNITRYYPNEYALGKTSNGLDLSSLEEQLNGLISLRYEEYQLWHEKQKKYESEILPTVKDIRNKWENSNQEELIQRNFVGQAEIDEIYQIDEYFLHQFPLYPNNGYKPNPALTEELQRAKIQRLIQEIDGQINKLRNDQAFDYVSKNRDDLTFFPRMEYKAKNLLNRITNGFKQFEDEEKDRLEQERLEQKRLEQEQKRLEQERLEQERLEQERLEQERLEQIERWKIERESTANNIRKEIEQYEKLYRSELFFPYDEQAIKQLKNADLILKAQKSTTFFNEMSKQRKVLVSLFQKYEQLGGLLHLPHSEQGGFEAEKRIVNTYWNNVNNYLAKLPELSAIQTKIKQEKEQSEATISFLFAILGSVLFAVLFGWGSHTILIRNNYPEWWASLSAFVFVVINISPSKIEGKFIINVAAVVVIIVLTLLGSFIGAIGSFLAAHWLCILLTLFALFVLFAMATK